MKSRQYKRISLYCCMVLHIVTRCLISLISTPFEPNNITIDKNARRFLVKD